MTPANTAPEFKKGDYTRKELAKLKKLKPQKGITALINNFAALWNRKPHNVYLRWHSIHYVKTGLKGPNNPAKNAPVSNAMPTGTKRAYNKAINAVPAPESGKDIKELVLEVGAPMPKRGIRGATEDLYNALRPLLNKMVPIAKGIVHSIPIATSTKTSVRKLLTKDPQYSGNKYVVAPVKDNPKMSRIFRYK